MSPMQVRHRLGLYMLGGAREGPLVCGLINWRQPNRASGSRQTDNEHDDRDPKTPLDQVGEVAGERYHGVSPDQTTILGAQRAA